MPPNPIVQLTDNTPPTTQQDTPHLSPNIAANHFGLLHAWLTDPVYSFEQWAQTHEVKQSTVKVKKSMWGKFCRWMQHNAIPLDYCTAQHIEGFFKEAVIQKEHRYRYIMLIELVYSHLRAIGLSINQNPGQEAAFAHLGKGMNDDMQFFTPAERVLIETRLRAIWNEEEKEEKSKKGKAKRWELRDAAMIGVIFGGGLRVMEACEMSVNCTIEGGRVTVPAIGLIPERQVELLPVGIEAMNAWQGKRKLLDAQFGDCLFPPDMAYRRNEGVALPKLHPSNVYRRVRTMLESFGLSGSRIAPQTLRNTYAAIRIEQGWNDPLIMAHMGFIEDTTVPHMRRDHKIWLSMLAV